MHEALRAHRVLLTVHISTVLCAVEISNYKVSYGEHVYTFSYTTPCARCSTLLELFGADGNHIENQPLCGRVRWANTPFLEHYSWAQWRPKVYPFYIIHPQRGIIGSYKLECFCVCVSSCINSTCSFIGGIEELSDSTSRTYA